MLSRHTGGESEKAIGVSNDSKMFDAMLMMQAPCRGDDTQFVCNWNGQVDFVCLAVRNWIRQDAVNLPRLDYQKCILSQGLSLVTLLSMGHLQPESCTDFQTKELGAEYQLLTLSQRSILHS